MTALVDLQRQMAAAVRGSSSETLIGVFRPDHLPAGEVLSVYRNHHRISLGTALCATFPTVPLLIGEEAFGILVSRFLHLQPPVQPCVSEYGAGFADYLEAEPLLRDLPYLGDIARLDWAINLARVAPDVAALDAETLGRMTVDQLAELRVESHPSMTLLSSPFPLLDIYWFSRGGKEGKTISLDAGGCCLVISRKMGDINVAQTDSNVFRALQRLSNGEALSSVGQKMAEASLTGFIGENLLSGIFLKKCRDIVGQDNVGFPSPRMSSQH